MAYIGKRVGISYISDKISPEKLYNEEITIDKSTGAMSVKTPAVGNVISYDFHARENNVIHRLIDASYMYGILKYNIFKLEPDSIMLPSSNLNNIFNVNLVGSDGYIFDYGAHSMIIDIDIDTFHPLFGEIVINKDNTPYVSYNIEIYRNGDIVDTYIGTVLISSLAEHLFTFKKNDTVVLKELTIVDPNMMGLTHILHSIHILFAENNVSRITSINVVSQHITTHYVGDTFNPTGIVIHGVRSDGLVETLTDYEYNIIRIFDNNIVTDGIFTGGGEHKIIFTYGVLTTEYTFNVEGEVIVALSLASEPNQLSYAVGDELNCDGMCVMATYNTGLTKEIDHYELSGFDNTSVGTCCVTVTCGTCSTTFNVEILPALYEYFIYNNEVTIFKYLGSDRYVCIPATIEGYPVTEIDTFCFSYSDVTEVVIPEGVKIIH